jgi:ABC-2 type transport system permease protein
MLAESRRLTLSIGFSAGSSAWSAARETCFLWVWQLHITRASRRSVKKYWHVISIGIQNNLTYRFNYLTRTLFSFIPLFAMLSLWRTIYASKGHGASLSGFTQAEMIFYYIMVAIVDVLTAVNEDDWQIAADIREGNISWFLLKPIDYMWYRLSLFFAGRITFTTMACVPLALFVFYFRNYFELPQDPVTFAAFLLSLMFAALLQFFISYTMAMLAFWFLEISTLIFILFAFEYLASGHLFPLSMLPHPLQHILFFTPFPYQLYFPAVIYMGKISGIEMEKGFLIQIFWVLAAFALARFAWARGIKKYAAFGG